MTRAQTVEIVKRAQKMQNSASQGDAFPSEPHDQRSARFRGDGARDDHLVGLSARSNRLDAALHRHRRRLDLRQALRHRPEQPARRREGADRRRLCASSCCAAIKEEGAKQGLPLPKLRLEPGRSLSGPGGRHRRPRRRGQAGREEEVGQPRPLDQPPVLGGGARLVLSRRAGGERRRNGNGARRSRRSALQFRRGRRPIA